MKRVISFICSISLAATLAGCSNSSSASGSTAGAGNASGGSDSVTLTMWAHQNEPWNNAWLQKIQEFEDANPGITINLETFPYDEFESKVQTSLIDGEGGADIYELWGGWALDFAPTGALLEIPEDFANQVRSDCYAPTYGALESSGKLYGIPMEFNIENGGLLVNLHLLDQLGLSVPATWEELKETAISGTQMDGDTYAVKGFDFVNWDSVPYLYLSMILQQGSNYLNEDGSFNVETEESKKAFDELASLVTIDKVTDLEGLTGGGTLEGYQQLYANKALMVPRGPWTISEGIQTFGLTLGTDFDYVAMPWYADQHKFAAENGRSLAGNAKTSSSDAVIKFMQFIYQDDVMTELNVSCTQVPSKKSIAESEAYLEQMPYVKILVDILPDAQFIGSFNTDRLKETINNTFVSYCQGKYGSIDEAMADMSGKLDEIIS